MHGPNQRAIESVEFICLDRVRVMTQKKRVANLLKKAKELSVLCGVRIIIVGVCTLPKQKKRTSYLQDTADCSAGEVFVVSESADPHHSVPSFQSLYPALHSDVYPLGKLLASRTYLTNSKMSWRGCRFSRKRTGGALNSACLHAGCCNNK